MQGSGGVTIRSKQRYTLEDERLLTAILPMLLDSQLLVTFGTDHLGVQWGFDGYEGCMVVDEDFDKMWMGGVLSAAAALMQYHYRYAELTLGAPPPCAMQWMASPPFSPMADFPQPSFWHRAPPPCAMQWMALPPF